MLKNQAFACDGPGGVLERRGFDAGRCSGCNGDYFQFARDSPGTHKWDKTGRVTLEFVVSSEFAGYVLGSGAVYTESPSPRTQSGPHLQERRMQ
jgi:hypothetical protein